MKLLRRITTIKKLSESGGTIVIKGHLKYLTYYFEIHSEDMRLYKKMLSKAKNHYILQGTTWDTTLFDSIHQIEERLQITNILLSHVYDIDGEDYIILNRDSFLSLIDQGKVEIEESDQPKYTSNIFHNPFTTSAKKHITNNVESKKYDWDEAYEEGLEEFEDEEAAENYADDYKR